jgi:hypothetical protein
MFHPVPRTDRREPLIMAVVALLISAAMIAAALWNL